MKSKLWLFGLCLLFPSCAWFKEYPKDTTDAMSQEVPATLIPSTPSEEVQPASQPR